MNSPEVKYFFNKRSGELDEIKSGEVSLYPDRNDLTIHLHDNLLRLWDGMQDVDDLISVLQAYKKVDGKSVLDDFHEMEGLIDGKKS